MERNSKKKHLDLSDEENEDQLKINKDFSERYERYRSKEVLQHLKDKYGDQIWQSDDEEESEDQNGEESDSDESSDESSELDDTELFDEKFLRVLGALKSKDKTIYEQDAVFYTKDDVVDLDKKKELRKQAKQQAAKKQKGKVEKMDLNDDHRKLIKEKKGVTAEDEEMENQQEQPNIDLGYYEELRQIKQDLLKAAGDEEGEDEDLIVGKKVIEYSDNEEERKKKDVKTILETKSKEDKYIKKLNKYWKKEDLNSNEQFLRDFIINKTYLSGSDDDEEDGEKREHQSNSKVEKIIKEEEERSEDEYDSDDSTHRKLVKTYESTRFHHEEPDADKIKRFPRQIESIRDIALKKKKSDKRTEVKERKKQQKEAELRKLRELKRDEIRHKINLLEKTTGNKISSKLKEIDIDMLVDDADFDAEKYDQKMAELFNDEYNGITEQEEIEKPKFEYDSDIDDEKYNDELDQGLVADGDDYKGEILNFEDDQDDVDDIEEFNEEELNNEETSGRLSKKKRQRLKKKAKQEQKKKEKFLKNKNIGIFEDVIDGQGVRFKYRKTESVNYGLTDEEILLADEQELNRWVSLKKSQQYEDDTQDIEKYNRKGKNLRLKKKILKSLYASSEDEDTSQHGKHHQSEQNTAEQHHNESKDEDINEDQSTEKNEEDDLSKKRKKKNRKKKKNKKQKLVE